MKLSDARSKARKMSAELKDCVYVYFNDDYSTYGVTANENLIDQYAGPIFTDDVVARYFDGQLVYQEVR